MAKDEWVRVKDEDELRAGMTIRISCPFASGPPRVASVIKTCPRRGIIAGRHGWVTTSSMEPGVCCSDLARAIGQGNLHRLADSQLADLSESRELENVRG